ncbi:MAG: hypothetical protein PHY48_08620 [Candidatus Cloacimonetes bacterium]|nr:hypothetical protein [Candidatus Cloacimonadota bacterium]
MKGIDFKSAKKQLLKSIEDYHTALNKRKKELSFSVCAVTSGIPKEQRRVREARIELQKEYKARLEVGTNQLFVPIS